MGRRFAGSDGKNPWRAQGAELNKRVGHLCFNSGLREFSPILGIEDLPLRLMPISMKFRGSEVFSRVFNQFSDQIVRLLSEEDDDLWIIERNPVSWDARPQSRVVNWVGGDLGEELIFGGTGGKRYKVEETDCTAVGAKACVLKIDKVR